MSVKTLNSAEALVLPANIAQARTYSIPPSQAYVPNERLYAAPGAQAAQIDIFLEAENPLGCIRGVMWVMVFNVAVFLFGAAIWEFVKFLR